jgi:tetratricopeptide (TPR) repeat protein
MALSLAAHPAAAQALKAEVTATVENGYARLVFKFADEIEPQVRVANNILMIQFPRPVDVAIDRIATGAAGYVSVARRDPDGKGVRIALARKVTMNTIPAGERVFIDLLPDTWTGLPPGLPREVIDELARRAREAERHARQQRMLAQQKSMPPIQVKVVTQPTFTRYVFDLPELIGVSADNTRDKLTLTFDALLRFDLADAKATLPASVQSIESEPDHDTVIVRFNFSTRVDVRTFREDNSFVVDVETAERSRGARNGVVRSDELSEMAAELGARKQEPSASVAAPNTVPAREPAPAPSVNAAQPPPPAPPPQSSPQRTQQQPPAAPPPVSPSPQHAEQQPPAVPPPPAAVLVSQPPPTAAHPTAGAAPVLSPPPTEPAQEAVQQEERAPGGPAVVRALVKRQGESVAMSFPFTAPTPAAVFRRADTVWLVFDTDATIAVGSLNAEHRKAIRSVTARRTRGAAVVNIKLDRPQLISVTSDGAGWTITLGNEIAEPSRPLAISRNIIATGRSSITIAMDDLHNLHRIEDPEAGDLIVVATATAPARGLLKAQDFVEFRALPSAHGVALQPIADDLSVELSGERIVVSRPGGLSLSAAASAGPQLHRRHVLDAQGWGFDRQANFNQRSSDLIMAAADAPEQRRLTARCDLARFYLARDMFAEAKGVLDVALTDNPPNAEDSTATVLRAVANIMLDRADAALKDLSNPFVGSQHDAQLWRAMANARLGRWTQAREDFRNAEAAMATLPLEFQRTMLQDMVRASIEVGDVTAATSQLNEFETIGVPRELQPSISLLTGRIAEALGRVDDALRAYRAATDSWHRPSAAQGRLREIQLQYGRGSQKREAAIADLETLTTIWRGDQTELEGMQLLARLYTEEGRYRDAFTIMRTALRAHPNSDTTRRIHDEAMATFDGLFLAGKGDALPAIDALALFYDFRELTPIGRRGDEMIRRLADRLVAVDLLYQATELLQHQVDHRLQGAARAQVATQLAMIYLMDHKPDRALATLRATRVADLNNDIRNQRLLLEARALSELGRHDVAYEVIENIEGREAVRLRADILWSARKWAQSAEQIELLYGDRWREFAPLGDNERADLLRAAIGYALGEDAIGLARFRERYLSKMSEGPDARAFEMVSAPIGTSGEAFNEIAHSIAAADTLEAFLRDLRARYPEPQPSPAASPQPQPPPGPAANTPVPNAAG